MYYQHHWHQQTGLICSHWITMTLNLST